MAYFTLLTRDGDNAPWCPQFGDYDRDTVEYERRDMLDAHDGPLARHTRILRTDTARQRVIDAAIAALNSQL